MFDEIDSGNEADRNTRALRLPSGEYDVPLMVADRFFDSAGISQFDQFNFDGIIGNKYLVNGKIQPRFGVEPRKYRLRILNPGVSRTYGMALMVSDSPNALVNAIGLYTTHCSRNAANVAADMRTSCKPSQMVLTPGSPSLLRPMKPPNRATNRNTSFNVGIRSTGCFVSVNR